MRERRGRRGKGHIRAAPGGGVSERAQAPFSCSRTRVDQDRLAGRIQGDGKRDGLPVRRLQRDVACRRRRRAGAARRRARVWAAVANPARPGAHAGAMRARGEAAPASGRPCKARRGHARQEDVAVSCFQRRQQLGARRHSGDAGRQGCPGVGRCSAHARLPSRAADSSCRQQQEAGVPRSRHGGRFKALGGRLRPYWAAELGFWLQGPLQQCRVDSQ